MDRLASIFQASSTSRSFRVTVFSRVRKKFRATCIVIVPAPCWVPLVRLAIAARTTRQIVDAAMLVEALVLGRQNGLFHDIRDFRDRDDRAALLAELAQQLPVGRNHPQRDFRLVFGQ